jgi:import receptor subunit TOM70
MSSNNLQVPPPQPIPFDTTKLSDAGSSSLWERVTSWASEHKAVVYTIAGVTVVCTAAGVVYYLSDSSKASSIEPTTPTSGKSKSKKSKRKAKKGPEETPKQTAEEAKPGRVGNALKGHSSLQCNSTKDCHGLVGRIGG